MPYTTIKGMKSYSHIVIYHNVFKAENQDNIKKPIQNGSVHFIHC